MNNRFEDRVVLVTGAGSGMGRAVALRLAREGAALALWGRRAAPLQQVADEIAATGGRALVHPCDIADPAAIARGLDVLMAEFGALHGVFANAGHLGAFTPLSEVAPEAFDELVRVNLIGTQQTVAQCLARMGAGAALINASWTAGAVMPGTGAYAATKAGLAAITRVFAVEAGPRGQRVNAISPGVILTPMAAQVLDTDLSRRLSDHTPLRRNGQPGDVAGTAAWLLSDDAGFVTGQNIVVDGGFTLGGVLR
ncbi:SDR family NAD(P)-dependent oxidoreductase [Actibacterium ureilyticum]|uniref:SDR family NAD(P)-dependent oxidoreductase n=1 Tax=Actibacterium ureilyticum TaxID=1590614 RepID=UPI000BAB1C86|nr:SDR family oxidoreductase [Actibacterium ureilyticum]